MRQSWDEVVRCVFQGLVILAQRARTFPLYRTVQVQHSNTVSKLKCGHDSTAASSNSPISSDQCSLSSSSLYHLRNSLASSSKLKKNEQRPRIHHDLETRLDVIILGSVIIQYTSRISHQQRRPKYLHSEPWEVLQVSIDRQSA